MNPVADANAMRSFLAGGIFAALHQLKPLLTAPVEITALESDGQILPVIDVRLANGVVLRVEVTITSIPEKEN